MCHKYTEINTIYAYFFNLFDLLSGSFSDTGLSLVAVAVVSSLRFRPLFLGGGLLAI